MLRLLEDLANGVNLIIEAKKKAQEEKAEQESKAREALTVAPRVIKKYPEKKVFCLKESLGN